MKYVASILLVLVLAGCNSKKENQSANDLHSSETARVATEDLHGDNFGDHISRQGALPANTVSALIENQDSLEVKIRGEITEVCQKKGCWMMMDIGNEEKMRVTFKNYSFFVPKDIDGQYAVVEGVVKKEITDVAALRHYAEDAGKDDREIEAISEPEENLVFVAKGVIIE